MCTGETAATDAQWGDRAFERQYRNWMGLRWLVSVRVHDQLAPGMTLIRGGSA